MTSAIVVCASRMCLFREWSHLSFHGLLLRLWWMDLSTLLHRRDFGVTPLSALGAVYQRALHDQKLAAEISTAKRDRDFYMSRIDKAKGIAAIKERKDQQAAAVSTDNTKLRSLPAVSNADTVRATSVSQAEPKRVRGFGQRKPKGASTRTNDHPMPTSLLSLIAGSAPT